MMRTLSVAAVLTAQAIAQPADPTDDIAAAGLDLQTERAVLGKLCRRTAAGEGEHER